MILHCLQLVNCSMRFLTRFRRLMVMAARGKQWTPEAASKADRHVMPDSQQAITCAVIDMAARRACCVLVPTMSGRVIRPGPSDTVHCTAANCTSIYGAQRRVMMMMMVVVVVVMVVVMVIVVVCSVVMLQSCVWISSDG